MASTSPQADPSGLLFVANSGAASPGAQTVRLSTVTAVPLTFSATVAASPAALFSVQPATGTLSPNQPVTLTVRPSTSALSAGVYTGIISIVFSDGTTRTVNVAVIVAAGATASSSVRAATGCTPKKLIPVFTLLGSNFNSPTAWPTPLGVAVADDCGSPMLSGTVAATFNNNDPPVALIPLGLGGWSGTWVPRNPRGQGTTVTVKANQSNLQEGAVTVAGNTPLTADVPIVSSGGVVGAAAYNSGPSPGTLISIFGTSLSDGTASSAQLPLETRLKNTSALVSGRRLPLFFTSTEQVNAVVPYDLPIRSNAQLIIQRGNAISVPEPVLISESQPAIFSTDSTGKGQGHIYVAKADGSQILADSANPAKSGDYLVMYVSGLGLVDPAVTAGSAAPSDVLARTANPANVTIGGQPAQVVFAGLTPGFAGLYQVNVIVPGGVAPGDRVPVVVGVGEQMGKALTIAVR